MLKKENCPNFCRQAPMKVQYRCGECDHKLPLDESSDGKPCPNCGIVVDWGKVNGSPFLDTRAKSAYDGCNIAISYHEYIPNPKCVGISKCKKVKKWKRFLLNERPT